MNLKESIGLTLIQQPRTVIIDNEELTIKELTPYYKHGSGFAWGYGGQGPHDLSWGICYRLYGRFWASLLYGQFLELYIKSWSWDIPEQELIIDLTAINEIIVKIPIIKVKWKIELHEFDPEIRDFVENGTVKDEVIEFEDIPYDHNTGLYSTNKAMFEILKERHGDGWYALKFQPELISSRSLN